MMEEAVKSPQVREKETEVVFPEKAVEFPQTREQEEVHLRQTYAVVQRNVQHYRAEVSKMSSEVDDMIAHFHDDNPEIYKILQNTITLNEHSKRALFRNEQALKKAYFGRIDYCERGSDKKESVYIGKGGIFRDTSHVEVVDWRAPISAAYYESRTGKCHYVQPDGKRRAIDVGLKRTYEVNEDHLIDFYDSETVANDELLTKYLAKNKQAVLGEIIASIQKEQDDIIRKSPFWNVLVQGVAGSGKTTVAMHRISYILYNYPERFKAEDFYIIGSNHILLNYITGVLPELDVYGARQMTMEELFARLLYEDWDEKRYRIVPVNQTEKKDDEAQTNHQIYEKGTSKWFFALSEYCNELEWRMIKREDIILNRKQYVQGFYNGTAGVHDITTSVPTRPEDLVQLVRRDEVERYIRENPTVSVKSKIEMLNQKLENRVDTELTGKNISYTAEEKKAIRRAYRSWYGKKGEQPDIFAIYRDFIISQNSKGYNIQVHPKEFDVYDMAALAFLYKRIKETDPIKEASHIVIDEAQDFGMMVYLSLKYCIPGCTYTIMGDVSQNIRFGYGLSDWEELKKLILTGERDSFGILKKSYRNTVEIAEFASKILRHGSGRVYVAEPVIRHGEEVLLRKCEGEEQLLREAAEQIKIWQSKELNTIAVVCRDQKEADRIHTKLGKLVQLQDNQLETAVFGTGVIVLPVEYTKGLEFDAVLLLEPDRKDYPTDGGHAKLLYVAATRALHELCILHCNPLSGLITDPIPENSIIEEVVEDSAKSVYLPEREVSAAAIEERENKEREKILARATRMKHEIQPGVPVKKQEAATQQALRTGQRTQTAIPGVKPGLSATRSSVQAGETNASAHISGLNMQTETQTWKTAGQQGKATTPAAASNTTAEVFGERPLPAMLKQGGHAVTDQAVRWIEKRDDGLYIMSRYGVLRLCPLSESILRVTFARGQQISNTGSDFSNLPMERFWLYKDKKDCIELRMDAMTVTVDKATGRLHYLNAEGKQVLQDRAKESRFIETDAAGQNKAWQFFEWQRNEEIFGMYDSVVKKSFRANGRAGFLSDAKRNRLPWLYSTNGYLITVLSRKKTMVCDIPMYGSFICTEGEQQLDYCVILGTSKEEMIRKKTEAGI